jgi:hypothetical protein
MQLDLRIWPHHHSAWWWCESPKRDNSKNHNNDAYLGHDCECQASDSARLAELGGGGQVPPIEGGYPEQGREQREFQEEHASGARF